MKKLVFSMVPAIVFVAAATLSFAQSVVTGELSGVVTDPTGATVASAKVTLTNDPTGEKFNAGTGTGGEYRFPLLRPGAYTLAVSAAGFQDTSQKVTIQLGQVANVTTQLGIQTQTQVVTVNEQAS